MLQFQNFYRLNLSGIAGKRITLIIYKGKVVGTIHRSRPWPEAMVRACSHRMIYTRLSSHYHSSLLDFVTEHLITISRNTYLQL